jgi:hypothetical protein
MQSETPESFRELCARGQKESNIETVEEIVDRLLRKDKTEAKQMSGAPKQAIEVPPVTRSHNISGQATVTNFVGAGYC